MYKYFLMIHHDQYLFKILHTNFMYLKTFYRCKISTFWERNEKTRLWITKERTSMIIIATFMDEFSLYKEVVVCLKVERTFIFGLLLLIKMLIWNTKNQFVFIELSSCWLDFNTFNMRSWMLSSQLDIQDTPEKKYTYTALNLRS